ncbi:hypothetical protein COZ84_02380 [Candidatus Kuenenbacteria bacterium CG_4_8_14_3_um_filter_39_15]|nr:MAG: hypothetical protein COZ84_02380 [Candidatus Kuenenbacteria bacterium CG_4_8_14_3_um_filter_39_15]
MSVYQTIQYGYVIIVILYLLFKKTLFEKVFKITPDKYVLKSIFDALFFAIFVGALPIVILDLDHILNQGIPRLMQNLGYFLPVFIISFIAVLFINKNKYSSLEDIGIGKRQTISVVQSEKPKLAKSIRRGYLTPLIFLTIAIILFILTWLAGQGCDDVGCIGLLYPLGTAVICFLLFLIFFGKNIIEHLEYRKWNENKKLIKIVAYKSRLIFVLLIAICILCVLLTLISPSFYYRSDSDKDILCQIIFISLILISSLWYLLKRLKLNVVAQSKIRTIEIINLVALIVLFFGFYLFINRYQNICYMGTITKDKQKLINICEKSLFCKLKPVKYRIEYDRGHRIFTYSSIDYKTNPESYQDGYECINK